MAKSPVAYELSKTLFDSFFNTVETKGSDTPPEHNPEISTANWGISSNMKISFTRVPNTDTFDVIVADASSKPFRGVRVNVPGKELMEFNSALTRLLMEDLD